MSSLPLHKIPQSQQLLLVAFLVFGCVLTITSTVAALVLLSSEITDNNLHIITIAIIANALMTFALIMWFRYDKQKALRHLIEVSQKQQLLSQRYQALINSIPDPAWIKDKNSRFIMVNKRFAELVATELPEIIGKTDFDFMPEELAKKYHKDDQEIMRSGKSKRIEERMRTDHGVITWAETIKTPVFNEDGNVIGSAGISRDISERKQAQAHIEFLADHDDLTKLPNRRLLSDRLQQYIARAHRQKDKLAVLFIDLDGFKQINDTAGHSAGDMVLQIVAERLQLLVRKEDTVARLGGDEFVLALTGIDNIDAVKTVANKILKTINNDFTLNGETFHVCASIGISLYPDHATERRSLLRNADTAMYSAKQQGRNRYQFFAGNEQHTHNVDGKLSKKALKAPAEGEA